MARRLWNNVGTLLLALVLSLLVWAVAVNEANPIEDRILAQPVPVDLINTPEDMLVLGADPNRIQVTISAPRQTWTRLGAQHVRVVADLAGLPPGTYEVPITPTVTLANARIDDWSPREITVTLERHAARQVPVEVTQTGTPAPGYEAEPAILSQNAITVTGASSAVSRVARAVASVSLEGIRLDFDSGISLVPVDTAGNEVEDVTLDPEWVQVRVPVTQLAGYRDVVVSAVFTGQVALGYQLTNITIVPNVVTISSADPRLVEQMPGFVETAPIDISGASDDISRRLPLQLPPGVFVEGDQQTVLVQVNVAAIEYSQAVERGFELRGLSPGLSAEPAPETVNVIIRGPIAVLDNLDLEDVRVVLDLTGLGPGTYQITPEVELLPESLQAENVLPNRIEVVISVATATPEDTPTPLDGGTAVAEATATAAMAATRATRTPTASATPAPSATPTATRTPSPTPSRTPAP